MTHVLIFTRTRAQAHASYERKSQHSAPYLVWRDWPYQVWFVPDRHRLQNSGATRIRMRQVVNFSKKIFQLKAKIDKQRPSWKGQREKKNLPVDGQR